MVDRALAGPVAPVKAGAVTKAAEGVELRYDEVRPR